eukprot:jgi/Tetstr1/429972/TSEL_019834.t1
MLAGSTQLATGAYTLANIGAGPLLPSVSVAIYTVTWPEISMALGLAQLALGAYGLAHRWMACNDKGYHFQALCFAMRLAMVTMQIMVQVGYVPGGTVVAQGPTFMCLHAGLIMMPAYLDLKLRLTPMELTEFYALDGEKIVEMSAALKVVIVSIELPAV